jgi:hypothetical protein
MEQREKSNPARPARELTRENRAELKTANVIRAMIQTEGWRVYKTILETHLQGKRNEFEQPAEVAQDGIAQVLRSESAKGAIMGLRLALTIPDGILANDKILRGQLGMTSEEDEE